MNMEHLLSAWPKIIEQFAKARHFLLLSDYDGTLTPIVESPELAALSDDNRNLLNTLAHQPRFTLGIISGRSLGDLKQKVGLEGIIYAGNHGFEIEGPGLSFINPVAEEIKPFFRVVRQLLNMTLGTIKGVLVEDKGLTLSVHYRQVEEDQAKDVKSIIERTINGPISSRIFKVTSGKKVYEVRPAVNWDKGKAIRLLMKKYGRGGRQSGLLPIYLGDDLTDEDGFRMIQKYGHGISVLVGEARPDSAAQYGLKSPIEVQEFLGRLLEYSRRGFLWERLSTTCQPTGH
jgi:trehalose 6-phosphate phosphatase